MRVFLLAILLALCQSTTWAQGSKSTFPLVLQFAPGGQGHKLAQGIQPTISNLLDSTVPFEFKLGASGNNALTYMVETKQPMLMLGAISPVAVVNQQNDIVPLVYLGSSSALIFGRPNLKSKSLKELLSGQELKTISIGFGGAHFEYYVRNLAPQAKNVNIIAIPYKGGSEVMAAVVGGHIDVGIIAAPAAAPMIVEKNLPVLANLNTARSSMYFPNVTTVAEQGLTFDGWEQGVAHFMIWVNKSWRAQDVDQLRAELIAWLRSQDGKEYLQNNDLATNASLVTNPDLVFRKIQR